MEDAILNGLLEITVYSAIIFALVALFRQLLRRWLSAQMRYCVWFLVILRLVVPFTMESGVRLITLPEESQAAVLTSPMPVADVQSGAVPQLDGGGIATAASTPAPSVPAQAPPATSAPVQSLTWRQWLVIAWGVGALAVLVVHIAMTVRLNRRIRLLGRAPGNGTLRLYARVRETLGIHRTLPVVLLSDITSPALTAQLRPKLLLPDDLAGDGTREEKAFSLFHELMHFKRGDHLVCLLITVLRAIWWFNPVVWIMPLLLRTDMESACDAQVVRNMDKQQKLMYANLLLELGQEE